MPLDISTLPHGSSFELGPLLYALITASDWHACCMELSLRIPQLFPSIRLDIYTLSSGQHLELLFSTHTHGSGEPETADDEGRLHAWYARLSYFWVMQPLVTAGEVQGWLVLAQQDRPSEAHLQTIAEQLAPLVALRLRDQQLERLLSDSLQHTMRLEQRLQTSDTLLLQATLAAGTVHDLGNLFTTLLAHSQLLIEDVPTELQKDVEVILRAAEDGRILLQRLQNGSFRTKPDTSVAADPMVTIHEAIDLTRPLWEVRHTITIMTEISEVLPVAMRATDLREVLVNLIINAIAAIAHEGQIVLGCAVDGEMVTLTVADNGIGIPQEQQSLIFQPLVTSRSHGSGLGLSISRALLEIYEGTLTLKSEPGKGTLFTITLPAVRRSRRVSEHM